MLIRESAASLLFVVFFSCLVQAAETPEECIEIDDNGARLDCYDSFYRDSEAIESLGISVEQAEEGSPVESRLLSEASTLHEWFSITAHEPNYVLFSTYNASPDYSDYGPLADQFSRFEPKFQLSLKTLLLPGLWRDSSLWLAYTQQSYWQVFADSEASEPFRETVHRPELIWNIPVDFDLFGFKAHFVPLTLTHESNGRTEPLSRSWNRVTAGLVMDRGPWALGLSTWARIDSSETDDNPDIEEYMGRVQIGLAYKGDYNTLALIFKNNLASNNRSGLELSWSFPLYERFRGYVQFYTGYGESLIDMRNYGNRLGIGIALTDWL